MELLRQAKEDFNQTIIMVTHDPRAAVYADRVIFLKDGLIEKQIIFEHQKSREERLHTLIRSMNNN